ncbi:hypothetical protein F4677DRAFT_400255 [Hypoxylon crocopeplum]|nr:hypothetical protein F4677DRAFT_400255 [Hypoxylon crocopeplum]
MTPILIPPNNSLVLLKLSLYPRKFSRPVNLVCFLARYHVLPLLLLLLLGDMHTNTYLYLYAAATGLAPCMTESCSNISLIWITLCHYRDFVPYLFISHTYFNRGGVRRETREDDQGK